MQILIRKLWHLKQIVLINVLFSTWFSFLSSSNNRYTISTSGSNLKNHLKNMHGIDVSLNAPERSGRDRSPLRGNIIDLLVIGSGPASLACAIKAAQNGRSVTVIEKSDVGGACANLAGPGKLLLDEVRAGNLFGEVSTLILPLRDFNRKQKRLDVACFETFSPFAILLYLLFTLFVVFCDLIKLTSTDWISSTWRFSVEILCHRRCKRN